MDNRNPLLTPSTDQSWYTNFLHPSNEKLTTSQKAGYWIATIALGVVTLGIFHLSCAAHNYFKNRKVVKDPQNSEVTQVNQVGKANFSVGTPVASTVTDESFKVLTPIFDGLDKEDEMVDAQIAKWGFHPKKSAVQVQVSLMEDFAKSLHDILPENYLIRAFYMDVKNIAVDQNNVKDYDPNLFTKDHLSEIRNTILRIKEDILQVLTYLDEDKFSQLKDASDNKVKPLLFDNIFTLAELYREWDAIYINIGDPGRDNKLKDIAIRFASENQVDKALQVTLTTFFSGAQRDETLKNIAEILAKKGLKNKAQKILKKINDPDMKKKAFAELVEIKEETNAAQ